MNLNRLLKGVHQLHYALLPQAVQDLLHAAAEAITAARGAQAEIIFHRRSVSRKKVTGQAMRKLRQPQMRGLSVSRREACII